MRSVWSVCSDSSCVVCGVCAVCHVFIVYDMSYLWSVGYVTFAESNSRICHVPSVCSMSRFQCRPQFYATSISCIAFSVCGVSCLESLVCHVFSVQCVMSEILRVSRLECLEVASRMSRMWNITCVAFPAYGLSCLIYCVCHVLSVWFVMSERSGVLRFQGSSVSGVGGVCVVCHVFSV